MDIKEYIAEKTKRNIEIVRADPDRLADLPEIEQAPSVCMAAVARDGLALRHVKIQTPEVCRAALKENANAREFVRIPIRVLLNDWEKEYEHLKGYGYALRTMIEQTERFCLLAVQSNAGALRFVREQTPDVCWAACLKSGTTLRYVRRELKTPELSLAAIRRTPGAIGLANPQSPLLCLTAIVRQPLAVRYLRKETESLALFYELARCLNPQAEKYFNKKVKGDEECLKSLVA